MKLSLKLIYSMKNSLIFDIYIYTIKTLFKTMNTRSLCKTFTKI